MRIVWLLSASILVSHCRPVQDIESRTYNNDYNDQSVFMAIGNETNGQFELFFSTSFEASEFSVCILESGQSGDGICIPNEKTGKYYKIAAKLSHQLKFKVTAKDTADKEIKKVLEVREGGQQVVQPTPTVSQIPESMNFELTDSSGKKTKVADIFQKKYLLVEFSANDCQPCRSFAKSFNANAASYAPYFENGQCSKLVIVDDYGGLRGNFPEWIRTLGADSYLGKASYTSGLGLREAANRLNFREQFGIPTLILIDRNGKVLDKANGMPSKLKQLCQQ